MINIKSYTDIEQSKKLAEILPLESSDGYWDFQIDGYNLITDNLGYYKNDSEIPCWSLAALLDILPYPQLSKDKLGSGKVGWMVSVYPNDCRYDSYWHDNPVDACVAMIEKLNELNVVEL